MRQVRYWALAHSLALVLQLGLLAWLLATSVLGGQLPSQWPYWGLVLLMLIGARAGCAYQQEQSASRVSTKVQRLARRQLLQAWRSQPGVAGAPARASLLVEPVQALGAYFGRFQPQLWVATLIPLFILLVVFSLDWIAGTFLLLSAPLIPVFMALVGMGAEHLNQQHLLSLQRLSGLFVDRLRQLTTLQLFGRTRAAEKEVAEAATEYRRLNMKTLKVAFLSSAVLEFFASVAIAAVAIYIGFALLGYFEFGPASELTLVSGLVILVLAPEFFQPLRTLSQYYHDRAAALGAAAELAQQQPPNATAVTAVSDQPAAGQQPEPWPEAGQQANSGQPANGGTAGPAEPLPGCCAIELHQLTFAFPGAGPLWPELNERLRPGEQLAITGPSGAGKSTLLHLLAGFLTPREGAVRVLGAAPGHHPIGYLQQEPFLGQGTLADNLRLVAPDADTAAMTAALQQAGLGAVLAALPAGLETPLGERGAGLSGGEARRLALARVYLTQVPVLLLDEPTAALDAATAHDVRQAIAALRQLEVTVVIATHDEELAAQCDRALKLGGAVC